MSAEPATAELIRDTLRAEGFRAVVAQDARQAQEAVGRERPGLVILDAGCPEPGGLEGVPRAHVRRPLDARALVWDVHRSLHGGRREAAARRATL
jgi:DNA-binding response OmpR family regulator